MFVQPVLSFLIMKLGHTKERCLPSSALVRATRPPLYGARCVPGAGKRASWEIAAELQGGQLEEGSGCRSGSCSASAQWWHQ